jgi:hypothetical protein
MAVIRLSAAPKDGEQQEVNDTPLIEKEAANNVISKKRQQIKELKIAIDECHGFIDVLKVEADVLQSHLDKERRNFKIATALGIIGTIVGFIYG